MLPQGIRQAILDLHGRGQSVRAIARALQVSRAAVRDVLRRGSAEVPRLVRPERAFEHRDEILRLLRECEGSFLRVHEELTKAGLRLSYPAFTAFCRRHGIGQTPKVPAGRYDFAPGQEMQHDTSPHDLHLGGTVRRGQTARPAPGATASTPGPRDTSRPAPASSSPPSTPPCAACPAGSPSPTCSGSSGMPGTSPCNSPKAT
jgi:transposase